MADIFLSFGGAHFIVEPFETSLRRQGHKVYSDADFDYRRDAIIAKLREFDAVIVIWSENSKARDLTLAVAAEALRLGRLIQTRAPDLRSEDIPPAFRPLPLFTVSDSKRIAEAIAALGIIAGPKTLGPKRPPRLEGIGSASGSPYAVDPPAIGSPQQRVAQDINPRVLAPLLAPLWGQSGQ